EELAAMLAVVLLGGGSLDHAHIQSLDRETFGLDPAQDLSDQPSAHPVGFHDEQRRFDRHPRSIARRASATVYREPVTRMTSDGSAEALAALNASSTEPKLSALT